MGFRATRAGLADRAPGLANIDVVSRSTMVRKCVNMTGKYPLQISTTSPNAIGIWGSLFRGVNVSITLQGWNKELNPGMYPEDECWVNVFVTIHNYYPGRVEGINISSKPIESF